MSLSECVCVCLCLNVCVCACMFVEHFVGLCFLCQVFCSNSLVMWIAHEEKSIPDKGYCRAA